MSEPLRVAAVAEGETDFIAIEAVLKATVFHATGRAFVMSQLQPEIAAYGGDAGPRGGGWKGVRRWCEEVASMGGLKASVVLQGHDLLIVHVDADVAKEAEVACAQPCPPAAGSVDGLRARLLGWLGEPSWPSRALPCIPAQATDAWVWIALHATESLPEAPECRAEPGTLLVPDKLARYKQGRLKKLPAQYRARQDDIAIGWPAVRKCLSQAERFGSELAASLSAFQDTDEHKPTADASDPA